MIDLVPIWTAIIGAAVFFYVLLDGFDLGIGILYAFAGERAWRRQMMDSVAPVWDGNETWLVLGGAGLLAAFPVAFAILLPAVYLPILLMLVALVFRGVAFEFHFGDSPRMGAWDVAFAAGSAVATFAQGIVLGAFIQGFATEGRQFAGSSLDCFTAFSLFTGLALMAGYSLLGAGWLVLKTEGALQAWARRMGGRALLLVLLAIAVVSLWTPLANAEIARRWFSLPNMLYLSPVPLATALVAWWAWHALSKGPDWSPFAAAISLFLLAYIGIAISLFPYIVPHRVTLWEAASNERTQAFLLLGTLFLLPVILTYTGWAYWVFRGKLRGDHFYH